jgi:nucleoid DNA-binding protein
MRKGPMLGRLIQAQSNLIQQEECMAARKPPKKATKRSSAKKPSADPARKLTPAKAPMTKSAVMDEIAGQTGLARKQVSGVFSELGVLIERHIKKGAVGQFTLPGLMKIEVRRKPATKARKGINPFTGEETVFKAKPARNVVKIRPLKALKDMVA